MSETGLERNAAASALVDMLDTTARAGYHASPLDPKTLVPDFVITLPTKPAPPKPKPVIPLARRTLGRGSAATFRPEVIGRFSMGRSRLGQLYGGSYQAQYGAAVSALNSFENPYDAFVSFTLSEKPQDVNWGASDAFQVNEALRSFERNYSLEQDAREAGAWGARFPIDMRGDMAFSRMKLSAPEYDAQFLGQYAPLGGYFDPSKPGAVEATSVLDNKWGTVHWTDDAFVYVKNLTGATSSLFYWYAHVYRALQTFIPAMAAYYQQKGLPPTQVYSDFVIPNLDAPAVFVAWVIAANTFVFDRFGASQALRNTLTDAQLREAEEGYRFASQLTNAENYFYSIVGASIKAEVDFLSGVEFILKVLALPVTAAVNAVELAKGLSWWQWGLIALGVGGGAYLVSKVLP